jgi:hypothetical protein
MDERKKSFVNQEPRDNTVKAYEAKMVTTEQLMSMRTKDAEKLYATLFANMYKPVISNDKFVMFIRVVDVPKPEVTPNIEEITELPA